MPINKVFLKYENKKIELVKNENGQFTNKIDIKKTGQYSVKVLIGNFQKEFSINIKSGFKEEDLF